MSEDAGESWVLTSGDNNIRQRAWYYKHGIQLILKMKTWFIVPMCSLCAAWMAAKLFRP
jgi:hypothetical protein